MHTSFSDNQYSNFSKRTRTTVMIAVVEAMEECRLAAIAAEFPGECGLEMFRGCLEDEAQGWSDQQFQTWFEGLEVKYGQRSPLGISMISLYRSVMRIIHTCDRQLKIEQTYQ
ncbi:hypothetical protein IQ244_12495 [Nostoc sp. LEGE 06077]|uniref:hypothetical protein n=1 Tax=Nostoc sp. LEGE 06077 TaxID=915325 RepID=UPI00187F7BC4|nr:hypothetical protein [Nostoc sp. LEGE 06077]MBE9207331.1 hypothetical protein [Nostoc sp. LEGE 06077]